MTIENQKKKKYILGNHCKKISFKSRYQLATFQAIKHLHLQKQRPTEAKSIKT